MKKPFFPPKKHIWEINLSLALLLVFTVCLMVFTVFVWHTSQPTLSQAVIPTAPTAPAAEEPVLFSGESKSTPWSGWWWPFYYKNPPNLYEPKGPMDKYDQVSTSRGRRSDAMSWEKANHYTDNSREGWFGHCNGWAAAAVLEPEPKSSREVSGVKFEVNDIMGLLSEWHWWDSAVAFYGTRYDNPSDNIDDIAPHEFHSVIIQYIGEQGLPIVMDTRGGKDEEREPQVWNFPAYKYEIDYKADEKDQEKIHVRCQVWFTDSTHPSSLKLKTFKETYYYWIKGDKRHPTAGEWETAKEGGWGSSGDSRKSHPDFLWYPAEAKRHPVMEREQYLDIVGRGENR